MKAFHPEINLLFNALVFFTRIPAPQGVDYSAANLNRASRYLPLVGLFIGACAALILSIAEQVFPLSLAVLLSMLTTILLTGAFHEDGLADSADGFGGGWNKEQVLRIMKDSRIGTYGVVALIITLAIKYHALSELMYPASILILGHSLSRFAAVCLIYRDSYVREDTDAKAKPLANRIDRNGLLIASLPPVLALLLMASLSAWLVLIPVCLITAGCSYYFNKRIGGYTGDCLGTCQQLTELSIYLFFCLPWFI